MSIYQIINTSTKGLWPESENVTLVQASSREAIIRAVLRGRDKFIERRLLPCHRGLMWKIKTFRGDEDDPEKDDPEAFRLEMDAEVRGMTEEEFVNKILTDIDENSINDRGFYTAILKLENVQPVYDKVYELNEP
jgi:hypothetical protein